MKIYNIKNMKTTRFSNLKVLLYIIICDNVCVLPQQQLYGVISMGELSSHILLGEHFLVNDSIAADDHMRHMSLYYNNYCIAGIFRGQ